MADNDFKVDFSVIDDEVETLELDEQYISPTNTDTLETATDDDKAQAAVKGKADSKAEKEAKELKEKLLKEEAEAKRKADAYILGDDKKGKKPDDNSETLDSEEKTEEENTEEEEKLEGISAFAKELYDINFFTKEADDEPIPTTPEELLDKLDNEAENRADAKVDAFAGRHGEEYRDVFKAIWVDGADPREYFTKFNEVQTWKGLDLEQEDNQEKVVIAALKSQGLDDTFIESKVKNLKLNSELKTEAEGYHKALVRKEEINLVKIQQDSQRKLLEKKTKEEQYKTNVNTILNGALKTKDLGGIPVTKELALKTRDFITEPKWKLPSGELITDLDAAVLELNLPQNHAAKVQLGLLLQGFESGKPIKLNLNTVQTTTQSTKNRSLFESLTKNSKTTKKDSKTSNGGGNFADIEL